MGDDQAMVYGRRADVPDQEVFAPRVAPVGNVQRRLLDAGRILVTGGWLVLTYTIDNHATNAAQALVGLALLLLGVFLIVLSPVANHQFSAIARAGAAVADAVLFYFFAPAIN